MLAQQVVDGHALEEVAARAVDVDHHILGADGAQGRADALGSDARSLPVLPDGVIDGDAGFGVIASLRAHGGLPAIHSIRPQVKTSLGQAVIGPDFR
ncbi:hypothetical protein SDC9_146398 [bioreactor metagenome]|uniref:Uncharacterized protein n=1 Tax=bioreactor metagenome TaxID=1076179 RepID=A0A645EB47_9ZZZZ